MKSTGFAIEFETDIVLEYSCTPKPTPMGKAKCTMELFTADGTVKTAGPAVGCIEWVIDYNDKEEQDVEHIGVWYDKEMELTDYDGLFDLPIQARELLNLAGIKTTEFDEED
jgi:hypothetical protein